MGGGVGLSQIAHVITHFNQFDNSTKILTRVSAFVFARGTMPAAPDPSMKTPKAPGDFAPWTAPSPPFTGRIAVRLANGISVVTNSFRLLLDGVTYPAARAESSPGHDPMGNVKLDAEETFGKLKHHRWHGFKVALPPFTGVPEMHALLQFEGIADKDEQPDKKTGASIAYFALGFYHQGFSVHHALAISLLQADESYVLDTSVRLRL